MTQYDSLKILSKVRMITKINNILKIGKVESDYMVTHGSYDVCNFKIQSSSRSNMGDWFYSFNIDTDYLKLGGKGERSV